MNNEVLISIIIPVYNVEEYLRECLDSILAQTFNKFEVICVDDGSTDKSLDILKEYAQKDSRFVIIHQENQGAGSARNKGIELAKGKYVQFLDSDDYFEPTMLEELYNHAEKYNADMTICSIRKVDNSKNILETQSPNFPINVDIVPFGKVFNKNDFKENIFDLFVPSSCNRLIKKTLIDSNNIKYPHLKIYEDIGFCYILLACANRIVVINKEFLNYRCNREQNLTSTRSQYTIESVKSCLYFKDFLIKKGIFKEYKNAYKKALINRIRAEISYCTKDEYGKFLEELKTLIPDEWSDYINAINYDYITPNYLNKIIGNKKTMLWGASLFLKKVLNEETKQNPNIIGIIDRNKCLRGEKIGNYSIYSPEDINTIKPECILMTILSNNELIYKSLKKEFEEKYKDIELLPNIFEMELN